MAAVHGVSIASNVSAAGTYGPVSFTGGRAAMVASASTTFPTSIQLQLLGPDGSTWINMGSTLTAAGVSVQDLPAGQYKAVVVGTTSGLSVVITSIPYV